MSRRAILRVLAAATGLPTPRLDHYGASLARAGLITKTGHGGAHAPATARDAARLLLAVLATDRAVDAPRDVERLLAYRRHPDNRAAGASPEILHDVATAETFGDVVAWLMDHAGDLKTWVAELEERGYAGTPETADRFGPFVFRVSVRRGELASILVVSPMASGAASLMLDATFFAANAEHADTPRIVAEVSADLAILVALQSALGAYRPAPAGRADRGRDDVSERVSAPNLPSPATRADS